MTDKDMGESLQAMVQSFIDEQKTANITAGNSKSFYGRKASGDQLSVAEHRGIINYEPTELVITARCGTPLGEIESVLNQHNQMLGFEPPYFNSQATLGGCIATGLSGPSRPYRGALRDFVLGTTIINGKAEILHFGGEVMKNVAGYDVSRLMAGAMGTLGIVLDVSLKILPRPEKEITLSYELAEQSAIDRINKYCSQSLPISAACFDGDRLHIRLSGTTSGVASSQKLLGGEEQTDNESFWKKVREQTHSFFNSDLPLWRCAVAPATEPLSLPGKQFIDWGGAQRWLLTDETSQSIFSKISALGGHATLFKNGDRAGNVFQPLQGKLYELHKQVKRAFDPHSLFNPGRLYPDF